MTNVWCVVKTFYLYLRHRLSSVLIAETENGLLKVASVSISGVAKDKLWGIFCGWISFCFVLFCAFQMQYCADKSIWWLLICQEKFCVSLVSMVVCQFKETRRHTQFWKLIQNFLKSVVPLLTISSRFPVSCVLNLRGSIALFRIPPAPPWLGCAFLPSSRYVLLFVMKGFPAPRLVLNPT